MALAGVVRVRVLVDLAASGAVVRVAGWLKGRWLGVEEGGVRLVALVLCVCVCRACLLGSCRQSSWGFAGLFRGLTPLFSLSIFIINSP